jgi:hypothetical protein
MGYRSAADGVAKKGKTKGMMLAKGGEVKESKSMVKKEIAMMKKAKAPKSMIKHEQAEMKKMRKGGSC